MGRGRFQGHGGQHHQPMGRLRVFFLLMVAVRVWPLFLCPHWAPGTRYTGSAPRHSHNRGRAFRPGGGAGATRVNAVSGCPGEPPAASRDATISCDQAGTLTAPAMSGHQG